MRFFYLLLPLLLLAAVVPAQTPLTGTIYVAPAANNEGIRPALICERGMAITADGRIWALSYWYQTGGTTTLRETRIWVSADGGATWTLATKTRMTQSAYGSMVVGTDGTTLHVAYQGRSNPTATYEWGIYYGAYDTVTGTWAGTSDTAVLPNTGTGKYDNVSAPNIAMNSRGTLLVSGIKSNGWSTWFKVNDGTGWGNEIKLQGGSYSKTSCVLEGPDDCFHFSYQSGGTYTAYYRRYDPMAKAFGAEGEIQVQAGISNETTLALSPEGDIWIGYITSPGSSSSNPGEIAVSHAKIGTWTFTPHTIYQDPATTNFTLTWGNHVFYCAQLARSANTTRIYYIIPTGTISSGLQWPGPIYYKEWNGTGFGSQQVALSVPPNAQVRFPLARSDAYTGLGELISWSLFLYDTSTPPNLVSHMLQTRYNPAAAVRYGLGCETGAKDLPLIGADSFPYLGNSSFRVNLERGVANGAAVYFLGNDRTSLGGLPLPFDLTPLGFTGCYFRTNIFQGFVASLNNQGQGGLTLPVPADPTLAGAIMTGQWAIIDPTVAGSLCFTGGETIILR